MLSPKKGEGRGYLLSPLLINTSAGRELKSIQIGKEYVMSFVFTDNCLQRKSQGICKIITKTNEFSNIAIYNIKIQKSTVFLYTSSK